MRNRGADTDTFYDLLQTLKDQLGGAHRLRECTSADLPSHGSTSSSRTAKPAPTDHLEWYGLVPMR